VFHTYNRAGQSPISCITGRDVDMRHISMPSNSSKRTACP
jgi:hypothetical protein